MQPVWLCIVSCGPFEDTFEDTQWRKAKQMQPVWFCILLCKRFVETFENTQWRKAKKMPPMWLCILSGRQVEDTFENPQWRKQMSIKNFGPRAKKCSSTFPFIFLSQQQIQCTHFLKLRIRFFVFTRIISFCRNNFDWQILLQWVGTLNLGL